MIGTHLIINVKKIKDSEILKKTCNIEPLCLDLVDKLGLTVVNSCSYQFVPYGTTLIYLLTESHLSVHTFVEEREIAIDLFTCTVGANLHQAVEIIKEFFDVDDDNNVHCDILLR